MVQISYEAPVRYPPGWMRTPLNMRRADHHFSHTLKLDEALTYLEEEVLACDSPIGVIYTSYENARLPGRRRMIGNDTGASVLLKPDYRNLIIACDKWSTVEHNVYALHLALRALRNLEQWGIMSMHHLLDLFGDRQHEPTHTATMPTGSGTEESIDLTAWMRLLGLGPTATLEDANAVYRRRVKSLNNDEHALLELNSAIESARRSLRS